MVLLTPYRALLLWKPATDQQLPPGVDPPHPMSIPFIQATVFDNSALLRVNRNILPGYCHCRHSSAKGAHSKGYRRGHSPGAAGPPTKARFPVAAEQPLLTSGTSFSLTE
jgi:hypothetical protein